MKNAVSLVHHISEHGNAPEGAIIRDLSDSSFEELEVKGLIREASAEDIANAKADKEPSNKAAQKPANKGV